ncbi:MAG: hypothetical protein LC793_23865 [Thermomicrobia bacterium]|nr:hypothetical protein [Thermomicrobia bacterium]
MNRSPFVRSRCLFFLVLILLMTPLNSNSIVRAASVTANVFDDPVPGICARTGLGTCSLREAIIYANTNPGTTVTLLPGIYLLTIGPSSTLYDAYTGDLDLSADMTIVGAGSGTTIIDGSSMMPNHDRIFHVLFARTVSISGVTIRGGQSSDLYFGGGGISNDGFLTLTGVTVTQNSTDPAVGAVGGGIENGVSRPGSLIIRNSVISGNTATGGGGIDNSLDGSVSIYDSTISGNATSPGGGAGISSTGTLAIVRTTISGNTAPARSQGGGISMTNRSMPTSMTIDNSTISDNVSGAGGGIDAVNTTVHINNSQIVRNRSVNHDGGIDGGGGINSYSANVSIDRSIVADNVALNGGGFLNVGTATITNSTVSGNAANGQGGGIYDYQTLIVSNSTMSGNSAADGGGVFSDFNA